ncbi:hypothetical protein ACGFYA_29335 [Streptomyces sp. NPDC048305]|uniref:hypothetical protein n=1 Tax=Streptomyces sp. NPDC048305 TaxID=3365532 RepID=UPI003715B1B5
MLFESVAALAAAGGTAVVQAVGTDAWVMARERVAGLFSRGDDQRATVELTRLDQTARELGSANPSDAGLTVHWQSTWQARLEMLLESLPEAERLQAAEALQDVIQTVHTAAPPGTVTAGDQGVAAAGNVSIDAHGGSVAGAVVSVEGDVRLGGPFAPDSP